MNITDIVKAHESTVAKSLKKQKLKVSLVVHFPKTNKTPMLGKIGLFLINISNGLMLTKYQYYGEATDMKE